MSSLPLASQIILPNHPQLAESHLLTSPGGPKRHSIYYFEDGNIVFQAGNTLFRVHRYFLIRDSPVFRDMLALPLPPGVSNMEGTSPDKPIVLEQVHSTDFERLLWMFYDPTFKYVAPFEHWYSVLALADKWQMDTIRQITLEKLGQLPVDPIEKIVLGEKYGIERKWALDAFVSVCTREKSLSAEEGGRLGGRMGALIASAREQIVSKRHQRGTNSVFGVSSGQPQCLDCTNYVECAYYKRHRGSDTPLPAAKFQDIMYTGLAVTNRQILM